MTIRIQTGYIHVQFSPTDWKLKQGGARAVIDCIKNGIGHVNRNPDGFNYDEENLTWIIKDTFDNRLILESAKEQYIDFPNQEKLF